MASINLGRIAGFRVGVDFSWFIIFFLILWSFTSAVFPAQVPGLDQLTYVMMGVGGTIIFFGSLLLHELSHAWVARSRGIEVHSITLFLLGGIARTRSEATSPGDEFRIAIVGPLASFAIAAVLGALGVWGARTGWHPGAVVVLQYLALLNLILGAFNLLPGFPLDGGRVLRAIVWRTTGDMTRATKVASNGGRFLAYTFMAIGLVQMFAGAVLGGAWLIFVGWFVRNAAVAGYQQHVIREMLDGVRARHTMTPTPQTIEPTVTLDRLVQDYFLRTRYLSFPVVAGERPLGIITFNQVKAVPQEEWPRRTAADTMTSVDAGIVVQPDDPMTTVMARLQSTAVRRVLVVEHGRLVGFITAHDVAAWLEKAGPGGVRGR